MRQRPPIYHCACRCRHYESLTSPHSAPPCTFSSACSWSIRHLQRWTICSVCFIHSFIPSSPLVSRLKERRKEVLFQSVQTSLHWMWNFFTACSFALFLSFSFYENWNIQMWSPYRKSFCPTVTERFGCSLTMRNMIFGSVSKLLPISMTCKDALKFKIFGWNTYFNSKYLAESCNSTIYQAVTAGALCTYLAKVKVLQLSNLMHALRNV